MPLLSSMRCVSESKTRRLDHWQLWKKIARSTLRLPGSARYAYVVAEAGLSDVTGTIAQHRLRLSSPLSCTPCATSLPRPSPVRCLTSPRRKPPVPHRRSQPAAGPLITERIAHKAIAQCADQGWASPVKRYEASPYASVVGCTGERERWIDRSLKGLDFAYHCFARRPHWG
jgi:hypothetical protein